MVLAAFVTIANFSKKTTFSTFPFVAEEIQIESEKFMDYSLMNDYDNMGDFTEKLSEYVDEDTRIYFIEDSSGTFDCYNWSEGSKDSLDLCEDNGGLVTTVVDQTTYTFDDFSPAKHFYFIMIKEIGGERYVYTNA